MYHTLGVVENGWFVVFEPLYTVIIGVIEWLDRLYAFAVPTVRAVENYLLCSEEYST
jgi:hypothetical protein